jgi:hypothetical protein
VFFAAYIPQWGKHAQFRKISAVTKFLQFIHGPLMWDTALSDNLASIANLIGERGEKAKQPLPVSFGAIRF